MAQTCLGNLDGPPVDLMEAKLQNLVQYASNFLIMDGHLLHQDIQACHKVIIQPEICSHIISQAHEAVGHKAIFSTISNLWQQFWWPMLEEDVKWFVSTCNPCQTQQLQHLHLPLVMSRSVPNSKSHSLTSPIPFPGSLLLPC